jgi:hypothetical protein
MDKKLTFATPRVLIEYVSITGSAYSDIVYRTVARAAAAAAAAARSSAVLAYSCTYSCS